MRILLKTLSNLFTPPKGPRVFARGDGLLKDPGFVRLHSVIPAKAEPALDSIRGIHVHRNETAEDSPDGSLKRKIAGKKELFRPEYLSCHTEPPSRVIPTAPISRVIPTAPISRVIPNEVRNPQLGIRREVAVDSREIPP
jgi:hypothetical protein